MASLEMFRGDGRSLGIVVLDNGVAVDLTDYDLVFTTRISEYEPVLFSKTSQTDGGIRVTNAAAGTAAVDIAAADTRGLETTTELIWDLEATKTGEDPITLASGTLIVKADVTHP